ncbi:MAG: hypothetical protein KF861_22405 [Planctomycetaceae bacterium]|nr:hypothetical protein [Planctomycetaceae bacterium]
METIFPFPAGPAADVCREFLERDMRGARLSTSFRAYYLLRGLMPLRVRQFLQGKRNRGLAATPDWYLPQEFCDRLAVALQQSPAEAPPAWPDRREFAFVLTHDVETVEGLNQAMALADIEEELGFRSSWNLVPHKYPIDMGLISELRRRGFEIGVHGYNHDGKLFWSESTFRRRARAINAALDRFEAVGFRAPMAHRNLHWMQRLNIEYDSSCFDVDPYQAMPGGIGSLWPVVTGRFVELPYTLPQDHSLFIGLGETSDRIWEHKLAWIRRHSGMALMLTHPDYLETPARRAVYRNFLSQVRDVGGYWHALPRDLARWWRSAMERDHAANASARTMQTVAM